ncbi:hypothetical protein HDU76_013150 [Blyttiomyces sp. JEL0837]|nr:hypothetical protein HDU76_013150 [Blyttiomyces sp. JEL0837]
MVDITSLQSEITNLNEHNQALTRELNELRKEKSIWKETHKNAAKLESAVHALYAEIETLQTETSRLRRQNEDLERKLEQEVADGADARQRWYEKEQGLLNNLRQEKAKVRELRDLDTIKAGPGYEDDLADSAAIAATKPRDSSPSSRNESILQDEVVKLNQHIMELTAKLSAKDMQNKKQEHDILELQRTVGALMDEIESSYEQAQFDGLNIEVENAPTPPMSPAPVINVTSSLASIMSNSTTATPIVKTVTIEEPVIHQSRRGSGRDRSDSISSSGSDEGHHHHSGNGNKLTSPSMLSLRAENHGHANGITPMKSFNSLADELSKLGEAAPSAGAGTLKAKLAAVGLNTEGNRAILKKRLQRYIARKKKQAEQQKAAAAATGAVEA